MASNDTSTKKPGEPSAGRPDETVGVEEDQGSIPSYHTVRSVYDDPPPPERRPEKKVSSEDELRDSEADDQQDNPEEDREQSQIDESSDDAAQKPKKPSQLKKLLSPKTGTNKVRALAVIAGGLVSLMLILGIFYLVVALIAPLKGVHFSSVLGSTGFAMFQRSTSRFFAQYAIDEAIHLEGSEGRVQPTGKTGFTDRRLAELGRSNQLKWSVDAAGNTSLAMRGSNGKMGLYSLNDVALDLSGRNYADLPLRQKLYVRSQFSNIIRTNLSQITALDKLSFRAPVVNALRAKAGIYMFRWQDKAAEYFGKKPQEARALGFRDRVRAVLHGDFIAPTARGGGDLQQEAEQRYNDVIDANNRAKSYRTVRQQKAINYERILTGGVKNVSDVAFVATLYCLLNYLDETYMASQGGKEIGAIRQGDDVMAVGDQMRKGDTNSVALDEQNGSLDGAEASAAYQMAMGNPLSEWYLDELASTPNIIDSSFFFEFIHAMNTAANANLFGVVVNATGFDKTLCGVVMNNAVQWALAIGELGAAIFTGTVSKFVTSGVVAAGKLALRNMFRMAPKLVGTLGVGTMLGIYLDKQIQSISGEAYTGSMNGPDRTNQDAASIMYNQANLSRTYLYAPAVSREKSVALRAEATNELRDYYNNGSFSERYFAATNPFSLVGRASAQMPVTLNGLLAKISSFSDYAASFLSNPFGLASGFSKTFMSSPVSAAASDVVESELSWAPSDLGFTEFAWSFEPSSTPLDQASDTPLDLSAIPADEPGWSPSEIKAYVEPQLAELVERYHIDECTSPLIFREVPDFCSDPENPTNSAEDALKTRLYLALENIKQDGGERPIEDYSTSATAPSTTTPNSIAGNTTVVGNGEWAHPTNGNRSISRGFWAYSQYGISGPSGKVHGGIDFKHNGQVYAACDGTVKFILRGQTNMDKSPFINSEHTSSNVIVIDCGSSYGPYEVGYHHTTASSGISVGDTVNAGTAIGYTDNSGISFGVHLHFTVKDKTKPIGEYKGFVDPTTVITNPVLY